jgi:hypothetical protein
MKRFAVGAVAAAALLLCASPAARAQTLSSYVFTAVDAVRLEYGWIYVSGMVQGETTPREIPFPFSHTYAQERASCERLILLAVSKPGQYLLTLTRGSGSDFTYCKLARVAL